MQLRQRRGGERWARLDTSGLHERQQLVRDLSQDVLGQPRHAEDLVARSVDVVSEWNKLEARGAKKGRENHLSNDCKQWTTP